MTLRHWWHLLLKGKGVHPTGSTPNFSFRTLNHEAWYYVLFGVATFLQGRQRIVALAAAALLGGPEILVLLPVWLMGASAWRWRFSLPPAWGKPLVFGTVAAYRNRDARWTVCLSAIFLRQIDLLSRPKDDALPGLDIGWHSPQPQSHIERIDAERGPKGKLADPMLLRMAGGAQRNGVAIARLPPYATIGSCPYMRGIWWRCFAAGYAGQLADKS
jgi:hypothetical protein